jgi:hypothetical protein
MDKKHSYRSSYIISRDNDSFDRTQKEPEWADDFFANLQKESVHSKQKDVSLFDQISQIIGGKSKYSNVEEAVLDMQKRTGLYDYLKKSASEKHNEPAIFQEMPEVKTFIDNYIEDRPGSAIEAVVSAILRVDNLKKKLADEDINDDVRKYINDKITESKKLHGDVNQVNLNLGKVDLSDANIGAEDDFFAGCTPATKK